MVPIFVAVLLGVYFVWAVKKIYKHKKQRYTHFIPIGTAFRPNGTNTITSIDGEKNKCIMESR